VQAAVAEYSGFAYKTADVGNELVIHRPDWLEQPPSRPEGQP
jgi:hypothetical protein